MIYLDNAIKTQNFSYVKLQYHEPLRHKYVHHLHGSERKECYPRRNGGKDSSTWAECKTHLESHGGLRGDYMDMSPDFIKKATEELHDAVITFDMFHQGVSSRQ